MCDKISTYICSNAQLPLVADFGVDNVINNRFGIEHEGEESYDNMWQKTRSIWKYINHWYKYVSTAVTIALCGIIDDSRGLAMHA